VPVSVYGDRSARAANTNRTLARVLIWEANIVENNNIVFIREKLGAIKINISSRSQFRYVIV
jgi:hypothetical protein